MSENLMDKTLTGFMDALASATPAPGGGSAAALAGTMGAALVSMVCNLTLGKKKYADVQQDIAALLEQSEILRLKLMSLLQADVQAYTEVSTAYKLPRDTEEQKAARSEAIQQALKTATEVPLQIVEACSQVLDLCAPAAEKGNIAAVSDAGVAALMAEAGLRSGALNVLINIHSIQDQTFASEMNARLDSLLQGRPALKDRIYEQVVSKL